MKTEIHKTKRALLKTFNALNVFFCKCRRNNILHEYKSLDIPTNFLFKNVRIFKFTEVTPNQIRHNFENQYGISINCFRIIKNIDVFSNLVNK